MDIPLRPVGNPGLLTKPTGWSSSPRSAANPNHLPTQIHPVTRTIPSSRSPIWKPQLVTHAHPKRSPSPANQNSRAPTLNAKARNSAGQPNYDGIPKPFIQTPPQCFGVPRLTVHATMHMAMIHTLPFEKTSSRSIFARYTTRLRRCDGGGRCGFRISMRFRE
jgi:hypothetical protein